MIFGGTLIFFLVRDDNRMARENEARLAARAEKVERATTRQRQVARYVESLVRHEKGGARLLAVHPSKAEIIQSLGEPGESSSDHRLEYHIVDTDANVDQDVIFSFNNGKLEAVRLNNEDITDYHWSNTEEHWSPR